MTKRYIRTTCTGCEYITAGKLYAVQTHLRSDDEGFYIIDDNNNEMFTMKTGSAHLNSIGEWEIVDKPDEEQLEFQF